MAVEGVIWQVVVEVVVVAKVAGVAAVVVVAVGAEVTAVSVVVASVSAALKLIHGDGGGKNLSPASISARQSVDDHR